MATGSGAGWAAYADPRVPLSYYGADPTGTTDATTAINTALADSAAHNFTVVGISGATYKVSSSTTQTFLNPAGGTYVANVAVIVPSGARVDWNGSTLQATAGANSGGLTVLCNATTSGAVSDSIILDGGLTVDGGGSSDTTRTVPMVVFVGLTNSTLKRIKIQNCSYTGAVIAASVDIILDELDATNIVGNGWDIGGNVAYQCLRLTIGTVRAWNVNTLGTFNNPGNGIFIGCAQTSIKCLKQRNCGGGIKYGPGCVDVHTDFAEHDGTVLSGETAFGTSNSGIKVQGDVPIASGTGTSTGTNSLASVTNSGWAFGQYIYGPQIHDNTTITNVSGTTLTTNNTIPAGTGLAFASTDAPPPTRMSFAKVSSRYCTGIGLYIYYTGVVSIDNYHGYKNARNGSSFEVDTSHFDSLTITRFRSEWAGFTAINLVGGNPASNRFSSAHCMIRNPGDVTAANSNGIVPSGGDCYIDFLEIVDDRSTPVLPQAMQAVVGNIFRVGTYRSNVSNPMRIQDPRHWLGNPLFSPSDTPQGTFSPGASATTTVVANANFRTNNFNSGWVQPLIEIIPMNASARALTGVGYSVTSNFSCTFRHAAAAGTELFSFRIVGYFWNAIQLS